MAMITSLCYARWVLTRRLGGLRCCCRLVRECVVEQVHSASRRPATGGGSGTIIGVIVFSPTSLPVLVGVMDGSNSLDLLVWDCSNTST